jgi:TolB-like protein
VKGAAMRWSMRRSTMLAAVTLAAPLHAQDAKLVIAVLPFENTGSYGQDKENFEALEVGIPEILGGTLAAHPGARVADPDAVRRALDRQQLGAARRIDAASATQVAKAAGARYAVTGSFADFYGKFRINVRLVDAQTGEILKVVSNDDPKLQDRAQLASILELVGERVIAAMGLPPYPAEAAARERAVPTEALTAYSRGLMFENRGDKAKAADSYQRALSAYPDYSEAREGLQRVR